ncbi:hypothetical protein BFP77_11775 [Maribacter sp. 4U21]|uniref:hypothetical protein n=1 Tax=Maribacter sp. 4U21 TaxID=1889779 RepID=UPI000C158E11|nr:hypothetical protein [Maribacter sp. 4U21]PIB27561.1 hypothetical protein BFP77_11775 [Maribacter sp. 4U21]
MKLNNKIYSAILIAILFGACSNNDNTVDLTSDPENLFQNKSFEEIFLSVPNNTLSDPALVSSYGDIMKEVLLMSEDFEFRKYVYEEAQSFSNQGNDYIVDFDNVGKTFRTTSKFGKSVYQLETSISELKKAQGDAKPIIFFPKAETIEDGKLANKNFDVAKNLTQPIIVLKGAYYDDYSAPGFKLDENGELVFDRIVTEDDAWENDVYVIGEDEQVETEIDEPSGSNKALNGETISSKATRSNGRAEFGGWIQITNLNEVEHWFSGKLEMRVLIAGVQGSVGTVIRDISFGQVKRKEFKDNKWYDFKSFLFNWNLSNLGDYNIEKWMEKDGGSNTEVSISIPGSAYKPATSTTPAQPAFPGTTVKVTSKRDDDDLGTSIVQFSDNITQVYGLGKMNFKRK